MAIRSDEITSIIKSEIAGFDARPTSVASARSSRSATASRGSTASPAPWPRSSSSSRHGIMGHGLQPRREDGRRRSSSATTPALKEGDEVRTTGRIVEVPVGDALIGRVVNPLGEPIDGKGPIDATKTRPIERIAPGVIVRQPVDTPVQTGIKAIDSMIPIGRGQRELIIGDRQTGKTAIAIDTIINQKGRGPHLRLRRHRPEAVDGRAGRGAARGAGAMEHTIVVVAGGHRPGAAPVPRPLRRRARWARSSWTAGRDTLCVYDDLRKQAWAYRQVSLLMRRPPGREAYPATSSTPTPGCWSAPRA